MAGTLQHGRSRLHRRAEGGDEERRDGVGEGPALPPTHTRERASCHRQAELRRGSPVYLHLHHPPGPAPTLRQWWVRTPRSRGATPLSPPANPRHVWWAAVTASVTVSTEQTTSLSATFSPRCLRIHRRRRRRRHHRPFVSLFSPTVIS